MALTITDIARMIESKENLKKQFSKKNGINGEPGDRRAKDPYSEENCMFLNGKDPSEWQRIVKIDDEMVNLVKDYVKEGYIKYYGMSNMTQSDVYHKKVRNYLKTVSPKDRLAASYTIEQIYFNECDKYISKIKEHFPSWQGGQKFDTSIFDNYLDVSI